MDTEKSQLGFPQPAFYPQDGTRLAFWRLSEELTEDGPHHRPLHRIYDVAYQFGCKSITVQRIDNSDKFREFYPHIYDYCESIEGVAQIRSVSQVCFLSETKEKVVGNFPGNISGEHLIGMAIVIRMQITKATPHYCRGDINSFVYEAIIRPLNGNTPTGDIIDGSLAGGASCYSHSCRVYTFHIAEKEVTLTGSRFHGSEELEAACIQSSLCAGFRHFDVNMPYVKMNYDAQYYRENIRRVVGTFNPAEGYDIDEVIYLISRAGLDYRILDCKLNQDIHPFEWAYLAAESGLMTYLMFPPSAKKGEENTVGHVLPVIGHTTNYHEWRPLAHSFYKGKPALNLYEEGKAYVSTANWAPHLLIHDDVLGPFHCLRERDLLKTEAAPNPQGNVGGDGHSMIISRIRYVVAIFPKGIISMDPYVAQETAAWIFLAEWGRLRREAPRPWLERFQRKVGPLNSHKTCVLRTVLIRKVDYIRHIEETKDYYGNLSGLSAKDKQCMIDYLPDRFWMTEFTCPQVYSVVRAKFGEILLRCDASEQDQEAFILSGCPDILLGIRFFGNLELGRVMKCSLGFNSHMSLFM